MWSNEKVLKLIEDYQASYCLWDVTSPDYKNRVKRKVVLESLAAKHNVPVADVERKIHNLKTSFNRERKKITLTSGTSSKKSKWFAYEYLQFLLPANVSKGSRNTDLEDTESGNNPDKDSLLDTEDNQEQEEALNVDAQREDDRAPFRTPENTVKRARKEDSPAQQAVDCIKSLSEIVSRRDEYLVFGEYVGNKIRNCNRPRVEVSLAQRNINEILFKLDMGLLAAEIPSIRRPYTSSTSITPIPPHSPSTYVSHDSYYSSTPTPTACDIEGVGDIQHQEQLESKDEIRSDIQDFVQKYTNL